MLHTWINWPLGSNTMLRFPPLHLFVFIDAFILSRCDRFLCPHSLVLVPFHFCLILSLFFFFFYNALTSLLTECYYSERKQTRALFTRSNAFHSAQLRFAGKHASPYSATLSAAKWRYLVGRSARPARWHADVMWDMLTWLMSDRDDARKSCFTTHHYYVTPWDVSY